MTKIINVYCDESCHLENDGQKAMVLGALWCNQLKTKEHNQFIAKLKAKHNLSKFFEAKWTKISSGKLNFYKDLVNYFFDSQTMGFRAWVIPDKSILNHNKHKQTHDDWYYKMYFYLLRNIISTNCKYRIYLDIKDTRSRIKLRKLSEALMNANYDFSRKIIERTQHVHSHDIGLLQLADILIGAISYYARDLSESSAKTSIVQLIQNRTGLSLNRNSLPIEEKFNFCIWRPNNDELKNA